MLQPTIDYSHCSAKIASGGFDTTGMTRILPPDRRRVGLIITSTVGTAVVLSNNELIGTGIDFTTNGPFVLLKRDFGELVTWGVFKSGPGSPSVIEIVDDLGELVYKASPYQPEQYKGW